MMRKSLCLIASFCLVLGYLSGGGNTSDSNRNNDSASAIIGTMSDDTTQTVTETSDKENRSEQSQTQGESKTLVIYFSHSVEERNDQVDAISSASRVVVGELYVGNTQWVAELIASEAGADIVRIEPVVPYSADYTEMADTAKKEADNDVRPEIKNTIENLDSYDIVYIGYPIWWYSMPKIMCTMFDNYDFSGKTIALFTTHGGSGLGGTDKLVAEFEPDANIVQGLAISRSKVSESEDEIMEWIRGIN